ncbi:MAG TPA: DUF192 domain-containing protein [Clostridiales bacterium]|nr:DUF192 domain-containing protein [Clostridiales bacterium]
MRIVNLTNNNVICENCGLADTLITRTVGLIGKKKLDKDEGLLITGCRSIHSCFMAFPICAIFIDKSNKVVKVIENFKIWRISGWYIKADRVIELPPMRASETLTKKGDKLAIE